MPKKEIVNNDILTVRVDKTPLELVEDVASETQDVIENTLEALEDRLAYAQRVIRKNRYLIFGALVVGAGVGGYVGYRIGVKRTTLKYEEIIENEVLAAKEFYTRLGKKDEYETPESAVEALIPDEVVDAINSYQGKEKKVPYNNPKDIVVADPRPAVETVVEKIEVQQNNVFVNAQTDPRDWDYNEELANRNPEKPYVISFEEFEENDESHEQASLSYYAGDDTLADQREQIIDNTEYTVGDDNLARFGHGSHDANVVYIRNEKLGMDFEIARSDGSYSKEVLGLDSPDDTLRHAHRRPNRRRWGTDE